MQQAIGHLENWGYELGRSSRNLFHNEKKKTSGLTNGDDLMVTGTKGSLLELKMQLESVYPISAKEHQSAESETMLGKDRDVVSTRSSTR